eukprot:TRINITY_DN90750_c0_g1_i1.p1 TRINITY_DN90750_c0_g1~~TRINITY_DN90750_c0_g1_i1.p1  ORF type:complete len:143 (+),score=35.49 TRINITY_DN90750_c0_g1_i1:44-472(+)
MTSLLLRQAALPHRALRLPRLLLGRPAAFGSFELKAQEEGQIIEVTKRIGDFCKKGELVASIYVQLADERGGVHGDEEELNMDGCEGLVGHHREVLVKAEVAGEVTEIIDDDVREVDAGQVVAVLEPMSRSEWVARSGRSER